MCTHVLFCKNKSGMHSIPCAQSSRISEKTTNKRVILQLQASDSCFICYSQIHVSLAQNDQQSSYHLNSLLLSLHAYKAFLLNIFSRIHGEMTQAGVIM
jgi:hypothetical protein